MIKGLIKNIPFLYSTALSIKHRQWRIKTNKAFKKYLSANNGPKLQLGAGLNELPGWFNTDYFERPAIFFLDVTKRFPFPNDTFDWVFSEHHIEHITYKQAQLMLAEAYRVMSPGGYIKITTPDLEKYIRSYAEGRIESPLIKEHVRHWIYSGFAYASEYKPVGENFEAHFINDIFLNYEHRFIYDQRALKELLEKVGFTVVDKTAIKENDFNNIETHTSDFDRMFTLYIYAQKPY